MKGRRRVPQKKGLSKRSFVSAPMRKKKKEGSAVKESESEPQFSDRKKVNLSQKISRSE